MQQQADEVLKENKSKTSELDTLKKRLTELEGNLSRAKAGNPDQSQRIKSLEEKLAAY